MTAIPATPAKPPSLMPRSAMRTSSTFSSDIAYSTRTISKFEAR
jgi:hypothetical protein